MKKKIKVLKLSKKELKAFKAGNKTNWWFSTASASQKASYARTGIIPVGLRGGGKRGTIKRDGSALLPQYQNPGGVVTPTKVGP